MLVLTVIIGLATAYVNGMHDGGTIVATTVTSRIMKPRSAILLAGLACLMGSVLLGSAVQTTMVNGIVNSGAILAGGGKQAALFAVSAFLGSMVWNLITWAGRLPSSASHSLIGSMIGCSMAVCGMDSVIWSSVMLRVVAAMILSPLTGFALGFLLLKLQNRILRRGTIVWTQRVRALDIVSTFLLALSYGSNEAQKVAGVICLGALASGGGSPSDSLTLPYLPVSITSLCGLALAIGAMTGGFNMMRMHIKLERARFYYHCDRLGMLVWQDMISGGGELSAWQTQQKPTLFPGSWTALDDSTPDAWEKLASADGAYRTEWTETARAVIERLSSHPCIAAWVLFNESWGQFCAADATRMARATDPTRPILSVSGWYDQGTGDIKGVHNYFRPQKVWRDDAVEPRAFMISEFGGLTWHIPEHATCPESYGYATFPSIEVWRDELRTLLASVDALEAEGLSGYVYTQVSDVEEETNGLMTYDRSVVKLDG